MRRREFVKSITTLGAGLALRPGLSLTAQDLGEIETALSEIEVQGARYPQQMQQMVGK